MVSSEIKKLGKVVVGGGKTARACDNCIRRRARWYCAADDAFLCQSCDGSVHSANPLARRHERVRLNLISSLDHKPAAPPPWYQGFTKKPRTPRAGNKHVSRQTQQKSEEDMMSFINPLHLVPEMEISTVPACEEQLLYRVPELCFSENSSHEVVVKQTTPPAEADGSKVMILPSDVELAEFAADVESLLGKGLDEESTFAMEGLGLLDYCSRERSVMKVEVEEEDDQMQTEIILLETTEMEMLREPAYDQLRFDYDDSSATANLWEEEKEHGMCMQGHDHHLHTNILKYHDEKKNKRILLKLDNYDGIIAAWDAEQRSPWTTGDRPEFDPNDDSWPECMGGILMAHHGYGYGDMGMSGAAMLDGGREARVSRYREKRRTRLFSKKIRYEVRKLNAEKRPRMKGRFVKRPSSSSGFPLLTK